MMASPRRSLPLLQGGEGPGDRPREASAPDAGEQERPTVLVVDDSSLDRMITRAYVAKLGYPVIEARDGDEALRALEAGAASIVVSDWMMEGMDGLELCRAVRGRGLDRYVYLVLATSRGERTDLLAGMEAGADDFLVKPLDRGLLAVRLRVAERIVALERNLKDGAAELQRAYTVIRDDLDAAAAVQRSLLPPAEVDHGTARIGSLFLPSGIVSGDSFNHFPLPTGETALFVLDVVGHGTRAALFSVMLARMLNPESFMDGPVAKPPSRLVAELNDRFQSADDASDYFTIFCARLSADGRRLVYCQAGHPSPLLLRADGSIEILGDGGFPVGMLPNLAYSDAEAALEPGDRLVIASDGLSESMSPQGELFGQDRLVALLGTRPGRPSAFLDAVAKSLGAWHRQPYPADDVTVLVVDILPGE
jgi:sigma-B regulation protein RsbU (phosphoserine phosphatase)